MDNSKYHWQQIYLHWISAVVILWGLVTGFYVAFTKPDPLIANWIGFVNVSLTTLFIPFFILRIWFFFKFGKPAAARKTQGYQLAYAVHMLIYFNILIVLVSGVLMMERPINVFNIIQFSQPLTDTALTYQFNLLHKYSCMSLSLLVFGHICAVAHHHYFGRLILKRMWPI